MNEWSKRSKEAAYLFNPSFCCSLLSTSVFAYSKIKSEGMPFVLSFIILPILLNDKSCHNLPKTPKTSLATWLEDNMNARLSLQEMIIPLKPFVQESILFGVSHEWLDINQFGDLKTSLEKKDINKLLNKQFEGETRQILMKSRFLGNWFALSGTTETIMALWGVRP